MGETKTKARDVKTIRADIATKLEAFHVASEDGLTRAEEHVLTEEIQALRKELSDTICVGANPCPFCGSPPFGMVQPRGGNLFEYEVGCSKCSGHFAHEDEAGELHPRLHTARGGTKPHHAVELWNDGPSGWKAPLVHAPLEKLPRKKPKAAGEAAKP